MKSPLSNFAIAAVRVWTRLYTWRMEPAVREARCAEIESDLWELQRDTEGGSQSFTLQVLVRLILGIPDDVGWRIDQVASGERASRRTVALTATVAGGVLFASALSVIASDATRKAPTSTFLIASRGLVDAEIAQIMRADAADSWKTLQAGILAVAVPVMGSARGDVPLYSQTSSGVVSPVFEVASIRVNKSGDVRTTMAYRPGGQFIATNVTLGRLIRDAFRRSTFEISGAPNWMELNRFDIAAKAKGDALPAEMRLMLRALLVERYQLKVHDESRQGPVYELVLAKSDGRFGPQLRRAEEDCARAPALPPPPYPDGLPSCGFIGPIQAGALQTLGFRGLTMEGLAKFLAPAVHRFVVDRTGLTGYFDGELDRTAELQPPPPPPGAPDPFDRQSFPSMFTELPERLGLKLRPSRGPIDVLVIDSVQQPTPD